MRRSISTTMPATSTLSGVILLVQQGGHHASRSVYSRAMRLLRLIPDAMLDLAAPRIVRLHERIAMRVRRAAAELLALQASVDGLDPSEGYLDSDDALYELLVGVESDIAVMAADVRAMVSALEASSLRHGARCASALAAMARSLAAIEAARLGARYLRGSIRAHDANVDTFLLWKRQQRIHDGLVATHEDPDSDGEQP